MQKVFLILTILAGIGTAVVSQVQVKQKIQGLEDDRDRFEGQAQQARRDANQARTELKETEQELATAQNQVTELTAQVERLGSQLVVQQQRGNQLDEELSATRGRLLETERRLSQFTVLGLEPEIISQMDSNLKEARRTIAAISDENSMLSRNLKQLQARYDGLVGEGIQRGPEMRTGLRGRVVAVDPEYDFVVLDIGSNSGVLEKGQFLVSRGGSLVAKVEVARVEAGQSIANVMEDWKKDDIRPGDEVVY